MPKVITITYDEQRDAIAAGFDSRDLLPRIREYEHATLRDGEWYLKDVKYGEEAPARAWMTIALDALLGFMERTKDT